MGCNFPMHAFDTGYFTDKGKPLYKICNGDVEFIYKPIAPGSKQVYTDYIIHNYIEIPCGKCIGCRLNYAKEWANRCMLEAKRYKYNYFITVTYSNDTVPVNKELGNETLNKEDLQKFIKRLRIEWQRRYNWKVELDLVDTDQDYDVYKKSEDAYYKINNPGIRYYACGEYGSTTHRPHYHILGFNLPIFDLEPLCITKNGDQLYYSKEISQIWGLGNVWIGEVNWNTCAYTARYIMKKQKGPDAKKFYELSGEVPEFVCMSLKPGIGYFYYKENKEEIYKYDEILIKKKAKINKFDKMNLSNVKEKIEKVKPARYYDKLYDLEDHEFMELLKKRRKQSTKNRQELMKLANTKSRNAYLAQIEGRLEKSIEQLKRNYE